MAAISLFTSKDSLVIAIIQRLTELRPELSGLLADNNCEINTSVSWHKENIKYC